MQSVTVPAEQTALSNARAKLADDKTAWCETSEAVHIAKEESAALLKKAQEEHAMQVEASICPMHAYLTALVEADALLKKTQAEHGLQHEVGCLKPLKPESHYPYGPV